MSKEPVLKLKLDHEDTRNCRVCYRCVGPAEHRGLFYALVDDDLYRCSDRWEPSHKVHYDIQFIK